MTIEALTEAGHYLDTESKALSQIVTPYDDIVPATSDEAVKFYLDSIRIYLGLCSGTVTLDLASAGAAELKKNPEYTKYPFDPTLIPVNEVVENRIVENLKTLKKYNLSNADSVRSALTFAFLMPETPIATSDLSTLAYFAKHPGSSITDASLHLGVSSRTITRSLKRLAERLYLRFTCFLDTTAFGINSVVVFFKLQEEVDWSNIETGLAHFPFTKTILKTTMTDLGYATFLFPGGKDRITAFSQSVSRLTNSIFEYATIHIQQAMGNQYNFGLLKNKEWAFSEHLHTLKEEALPPQASDNYMLRCQGPTDGFSPIDFLVASHLKLDYRAPPRKMVRALEVKGFDFDAKEISEIIRRLKQQRIVLPYISFDGVGLDSSFCFEIICNKHGQDYILRLLRLVPQATFFVSAEGLIVWLSIPSKHQVLYYNAFENLERRPDIDLVQPILTVRAKGSRGTTDFATEWSYGRDDWDVDPYQLDLSRYMT